MARWIAEAGARDATEARAREEQQHALDAVRGAVPDDALSLLAEFAGTAVGRVS